jgi:hypothetical protein
MVPVQVIRHQEAEKKLAVVASCYFCRHTPVTPDQFCPECGRRQPGMPHAQRGGVPHFALFLLAVLIATAGVVLGVLTTS